jgi:hypothetical protein
MVNRTVPPRSGRGIVFLPFDVAFRARQKSCDRAEAAGSIRVGIDPWVVFEILTVPHGCRVDFVDRLADMAR